MGCDIHGYIEVKDALGVWRAVASIDEIVSRNYDVFRSLFGVRCYKNEEPVSGADLRGFPNDADDLTREEFKKWEMGAHSVTWVTYKEFKENLFKQFGNVVPLYEKDEKKNKFVFKKTVNKELLPEEVQNALEKDSFFLKGDKLYLRLPYVAEYFTWSWLMLLTLLDMLGRKYGDENVRIVVWFDN